MQGVNLLDAKARTIGFNVKERKGVQAEINKRLNAYALSKDELLALQGEVARADISDMFHLVDVCCPVCEKNGLNTVVLQENAFSMRKTIAVGKAHLVKEIQHLRNGTVTKVVLHDATEARNSLMKALSMFTTKTDTAVSGLAELMSLAFKDREDERRLEKARVAKLSAAKHDKIDIEITDVEIIEESR